MTLRPGYSSGEALAAMEEVAREALAGRLRARMDRHLVPGKGQRAAARPRLPARRADGVPRCSPRSTRSWTLPFAVILAVPFALFGAFLAVFLRGQENDLYFQIGLVTLVGLASKNAILIVEFAQLKVQEGMSLADAAVEGARLRFRPIVMTSLAFILGVLAARDQRRRRRRRAGIRSAPASSAACSPRRSSRRSSCRCSSAGSPRAAWTSSTRPGRRAAMQRNRAASMPVPLLLATMSLLVAACAVTREPERKPELPLPAAMPAVVGTTVDLPAPWWTLFGDPTLDALVRESLANNADAAIAAARVAEARAIARVVRADRLPQLNLEAGAVRGQSSQLTQPELPVDGATRNEFFARGVVSYELDLWGRFAHASEAARNRLLATEFDRDAFRLSLSGETARAYFALAAAIGQYEQARATLANREDSLRIEKLRFDGGESEEITYRRVEAEVATARAAMLSFELEVERRQNVLGLLLGRTPRELVEQKLLPQALGSSTAVALLPEGLPADVLTRRPDIRAAEAQTRGRRR